MCVNRIIYIGLISLFFYSCSGIKNIGVESVDYISYVDPLIGSGGHGHVFVGASVPHGMVQLGPNNLSKGWDWCSGYHDSDSTIIGFSHSHLSGTGIADLADIIFMPVTHMPDIKNKLLSPEDYVSTFSKHNEIVSPGYYSVILDKYRIKVEMTATERTGLQKYSYPEDKDAYVLIDLDEGAKSLMTRKGTLESSFQQLNDSVVNGYRVSDEWALDHKTFFTTVFSAPIKEVKLYKNGNKIKVGLFFGRLKQPLLVKTGISYVSEKGAGENVMAELPDWNFNKVVDDARKQWNQALGVIDYHSDEKSMKIFYTSLYHTMIAPSVFNDVDGNYRGADGKIYKAEVFTPYTTFSLWDTYRAVHPLYTLIDSRVEDYVNTLLTIYDQQGKMPVWHLVGNETKCMVGLHSIPVVVDACLKGFKGVDKKRAYMAVSSIDNMNDDGLSAVREKGFIPADKISWSVAKGLEYAVDDYSVAQLAKDIGNKEGYDKFIKRSKNYKHYFDPSIGFMRGKLSDGTRRKEFDPFHSIHMEDDYVEGNAWQYTWLVPHDVEGLVQLFGGKEPFVKKLDSLFSVSSELNEGASVDISGMIGQYAHGNEPSHHILYLYPYVGQAWKTAEFVRQVYKEFYKDEPDGLIGNEDCGQMSAWYIFSALGFYPVNPVDGTFVFGSPLLNEATIKLNNGKSFKIIAHNNCKENKYIQAIKLNGKEYSNFYINYNDIMNGGTLEFEMGTAPTN